MAGLKLQKYVISPHKQDLFTFNLEILTDELRSLPKQ